MSKSIIVTGGFGNLGRSVMERLIKDGYNLHASILQGDGRNAVAEENIQKYPVDLMDESSARDFVEKCSKAEKIEAAVLIVGGFGMGNIETAMVADFEKMIALNFYTAFNIVKPLIEVFKKQEYGGRFILIGSKPGQDVSQGLDFVPYTFSKSLVFRLAEVINASYQDQNITAHVIVPGTMDTRANRQAMPGADFSQWVPTENVADAISFTLSETGKMLRESVIKIYNKS